MEASCHDGRQGNIVRRGAFGFADTDDGPVPYMQRTREYYAALGHGAPYEWAHYAEVPFAPLRKSLREKMGGQTGATIHRPAPWCKGGNPQAPEVCAIVF